MLEKPTCKPRKLRPVILSCDNRLDTFKTFVESYKKIASSMLRPVVLAGYNYPERRQEYDELLQQLNPYRIIEQRNHYWDKDPTEDLSKLPQGHRRLNYLNIQKVMTKDFPRIALEHSKEDVIFIEDDALFSGEFPKVIKKVSQYLQSSCDFVTLYSPSPRPNVDWDIKMGITKNGYSTNPSLPSNSFIHGIDGGCYYGNICAAFSRETLISLRDNWEAVESLSTAVDQRWGAYMAQNSFRVYATGLSYAQHQAGFSVLEGVSREEQTETFYNPEAIERIDQDLHFKIIIPLYNSEEWTYRNIESIQSQDYTNYQVVIVDDCSTDNTYDIASELIKDDERFTLIRNGQNWGSMYSTIVGINTSAAKDEDVIIRVDGDDWLARIDALSILKKAYDTEDCLMTYGSYLEYPAKNKKTNLTGWGDGGPTLAYPEECIINNNFREHAWLCSHLMTFKYHLWRRTKDSDFRDTDGRYYSMSSDVAMMLPMLEMAGTRQYAIPEILYIYNQTNPLSDFATDRKLQLKLEKRIKKQEGYAPVNRPKKLKPKKLKLKKPKKLRPFILTCDARIDMFKEFVESYKAVAHTMLPPVVLAGFDDPSKRRKYKALIKKLKPHKVIEQPNYIDDDEIDIELSPINGHIRTTDPKYFNIQKIMVKDFPEIALKYSKESIIWIEDDAVFSSQFAQAIEKATEHLQSDCDFITLYSPSLEYYTSDDKMNNKKKGDADRWQLERGIADYGYTTKKSLPSDDFIHAINGNNFYGTACVMLSHRVIKAFKTNWREMETLAHGWDLRWGMYMENYGFKTYATRRSYVRPRDGYSVIAKDVISMETGRITKTFVE